MKFSGNSLSSVFDYVQLQLGDLYPEQEIRSMTKILLEHLFSFNGKYLSLHPNQRFTESELLQIIGCVKQLKTGKPIQYVTGFTDFASLKIKVNENVLIPRQETEELVQWIITTAKGQDTQNIIDIGTGSGIIALALKKNMAMSNIIATDVSEAALHLAQENAMQLELQVNFIQDDILNSRLPVTDNRFDVVVSNPPYVMKAEKNSLHKNVVDFEPHLALFVENDDPLCFYKSIAEVSTKILKKNGLLYFEINEALGQEVGELLKSMSYDQIELRKDLNGRNRMVRARLPQ